MYAYALPITTTGTPTLTVLKGTQATDFWGLSATNNETSTVIYLKLFWQGNTNTAPVIGTTTPNITIAIPTNGIYFVNPRPCIMGGPLWWVVTKLQAYTDTTALSTAGEAITLFLE